MNTNVLILGGGVAGSSVALQLARHGKNVTLLEKEAHAHDKVCGEFISVEASHYLSKLGIDLLALGAVAITHVRLIHGKDIATAKLPFHGYSLSRRQLDQALLTLAEKNGANVRRNATVSGLKRDTASWTAIINGQECLTAPHVFLATGKHDVRGWPRAPTTRESFIGFKMHVKLSSAQQAELRAHTELYLFAGGYAGLQPIEDNNANLCLVATKSCFLAHGKNWNGFMDYLKSRSPVLSNRLVGSLPCWPTPHSIANIPYGYLYRNRSEPELNLYRLGDQMAVIPSFSGDGIAIALHTANMAANHYLGGSTADYHRLAHDQLAPQIRKANLAAQLLMMPLLHSTLITACQFMPGLMPRLARSTRLREFRDAI